MLLGQNFLPLVISILNTILHFTAPLHKYNSKSQLIMVADERKYRKQLWIATPYLLVLNIQWVHAWWRYPLPVVLQSTPYSTICLNSFCIVAEHYKMRNEMANLINSFLCFEKRHNSNFSYKKYNLIHTTKFVQISAKL